MIDRRLEKNKLFRRSMNLAHRWRAQRYMIRRIEGFLKKGDKILDIGSGPCNVCQILSERGFDITPIDIKNLSVVDGIKPIIFDGEHIPFKDNTFDVSLLLTVLHHTSDPENIIKEAKRVSKRIIIIEDIYSNPLHKHLTFFADSLGNFEFKGHPHSNKNDAEWRRVFRKLHLELIDDKKNYCFPVFTHATYFLKK